MSAPFAVTNFSHKPISIFYPLWCLSLFPYNSVIFPSSVDVDPNYTMYVHVFLLLGNSNLRCVTFVCSVEPLF